MSTKYFALLTQLGADKLANAAALGTKIEITHMAVGDGGGSLPVPDTKQTKLINEKRRAAINTLSIDPKNTNQIIAEQVIPEAEGGWWIREIGLYDKDGVLVAVGNCAETYKPQLQEGSGRTQTIRMILIVSSANAVTLKVDPSIVLATREYVDNSITKHANSRNHPDATLKEKGFVILSSAVDSNSETHAATPKAVKAAYDLANAANNNANTRLEKSKNGADVTDKDAFNRNIGSARAFTGAINIGGGGVWTTAEFIEWLKSQGAFNHPYWVCKGSWSYASNRRITETGCGSIHLAGAVVEVMGIESVMTIRVTTAPTSVDGCIPNAQFTYGNHGKDYQPSWRRDYNTTNKPTSGEIGAYSKDETDAHVSAAHENANSRLEKNKNGADIPNKDEFVKNLGLTETQQQAQNAYPKSGGKIEGKVDVASDIEATGWIGGKELWERKADGGWVRAYSPQNKPTAEEIQVEPRFSNTIDLTGLSSDRYYPVWWRFPPNYGGANAWLTIHRGYGENHAQEPFGKGETHLAGLQLQIEGSEYPWGGDAKYLNIKRICQTYRKTVKNIRYRMMSIARPVNDKYPLYGGVKSGDIVDSPVASGCYLRGGLTYHITSNFDAIHHSNKDDETQISSWENGEQEIRWMVKSYAIDDPLLGKEYDDNVLPYSHDYKDIIELAKNAVPNSQKVNGKPLTSDITLSAGDVEAFSKTNHMDKIPDQSYIGAFSCGHEGEWVKGISLGTGGDVGQIWIDSSAMLHTRFLNTNGNHKQQSYTARGECYTKSESDNRFIPLNKGTITSGYLLSKTANYIDDPSSRHLGRSGFLRTNGMQNLSDFAIHIAHPNVEGPQHARGISFNYGYKDSSFGITTYAFDEEGNFRGHKRILTEDDKDSLGSVPVGVPLPWPQANPPSGYLICNGERFDKSKCPQLAKAYPSGFLPDLRGEFIRGLDAGRNIDSGRKVLSSQEGSIQSHTHSGVFTGAFERESGGRGGWGAVNTNGNTSATGGNETRPRNIAFLYIVKAS